MKTPYFEVPLVDAAWYHKEALKILDQGWVGDSVFFMAPLYQYFLAIIYKVFGIHIGIVLVLQSILSVLSVWLIYLLGKDLFDRSTGLLSAALAAFHGVFIFYSGFLLKANLSLFFTCLFLVVFLKTYKNPIPRNFFWCGLILGILIPIRGNFLIVFAGFFTWLFFYPLRQSFRFKNIIAFSIGMALFVAPFTARNYYVSQDFVLVNSAAGFNFFIGNNPISDGYNIAPSYIRLTPFYEEIDSRKRAELKLGRPLKASEVSDYWMNEGWRFVREHPFDFTILQFKKLFIFISNSEKGDNYDFAFMRTFTPILHIGFIPYGAILLLALAGIYWGRWKTPPFIGVYLFIITYTLSVILFFVKSRYRIPVVPAMIPLAAYALLEGKNNIFRMSKKELTLFCLGILIIGSLVFRPIQSDNRSAKLNDYGVALETKGLLDDAIAHYKKALEIPPVHRRAALNLALAYYQKKMITEALFFCRKALEIDEKFVEARILLASFLFEQKSFNAASEEYRKVLQEEPNNNKAHYQLAGIYFIKKQLGLAEKEFQKALKNAKNPAQTYNNLGIVYLVQGKLDQAKKNLQKAIELKPGLSQFYYNLGIVYNLQGFSELAQKSFQSAKRLNKFLPRSP
mgnify:CR=1 FL=1|jgi:Flp pilus assembly protein TadD/4-amino-4-deoxy-L-arabinose transferase-like glycosyltransferase